MARPNVIYNCQALFVGPAPESGYNYFDYNGGAATNDHSNLVQKINRLNPIDRVQSVTYQINIPHEDILQLNQRGIVDRPIINYPTVDLSFNYLWFKSYLRDLNRQIPTQELKCFPCNYYKFRILVIV